MQDDDFLWVAIGDIHDDMRNFEKIPELDKADGILVTGDLTIMGGIEEAGKVMKKLQTRNIPVFAQIGNMDKPEVTGWLDEAHVNMHLTCRELSTDTAVFGVGASTITPFNTPSEYPEEKFAEWLESGWNEVRNYPHKILVSHNPPKDTKCDMIPGGVHVGSIAIREFILKNQPEICICGHIHESRGTDMLGRTAILNPGPLADGGYVLVSRCGGKLDAKLNIL